MHHETQIFRSIVPPVHLDILSSKPLDASNPQPTVVYFHGGGLTAGSRRLRPTAVLPQVLLAEGWAIVSADYHLLPESGVPEILEDVQELEKWLLQCKAGIDLSRLIVAGSSAGAFVSLLAISSWQTIKPRAFFSQYGMVNTAGPWYSSKKSDDTIFSAVPAGLLLEENFAKYFEPGRPQISCDEGDLMAPDGRAALFLWMLKQGKRYFFLIAVELRKPMYAYRLPRSNWTTYQRVHESRHW